MRVTTIATLTVALLLCVTSAHALTPLGLTGDLGQSTNDNYFTKAQGLAGTLNDGFAYNPFSPTSPLPFQSYTGASPVGFHGTDIPAVVIAYDFSQVVSGGIIFDLYGRSDAQGSEFRDDGMVLRLYNGDWTTPVFTSAPFDIPNNPPWYTRFVTPDSVVAADRMSLTGTNYFTLLEIRAEVPEPSMALAGIIVAAPFLVRRVKRSAVRGSVTSRRG